MELSSAIKFSPPFRRSIGISSVAALCPAKIVQTGFVDRVEAESMLALKKVKNCLSTCDNSKASTTRLSLKSRRIPLTVLTVRLPLSFILLMGIRVGVNRTGVSLEKVEIDLVLQPKSAKKFWGKQKFTSIDMENVVACDLNEVKNNGKSVFRIVYFSQNAHEFKHYHFETDADDAGEIVEQVNHIIKSNMSGKRSEYLSSKERKSDKRRS